MPKTYTVYANLGTDTREKFAVKETQKDIIDGAQVTSTSYLSWSAFSKIELVVRDSTGADVATVDSVSNAALFTIEDTHELYIKFGKVPSLVKGQTYQGTLKVYDGTTYVDGNVIISYADQKDKDTLVIIAK